MNYQKPPAFARKDLLSPGAYNQHLVNARAVEGAVRGEHILSTGEHNSPLIARTCGSVKLAAGPTYSLDGFNADASLAGGHNPAVGELILTLAANRYSSNLPALMVQNASATGATKPCVTAANFVDDTHIEFYSRYLSSSLNAANTWADEDAAFHVAVHGYQLDAGGLFDYGSPRARREGLRAGTTSTNMPQLIQGAADLQAALDIEHTAGAHDARTIAKSWAHVHFDTGGFTYDIVESDFTAAEPNAEIVNVSRSSAGVIDIELAGSCTGPLQVFIEPIYQTDLGSTAANGIWVACVPFSTDDDHAAAYLYAKSRKYDLVAFPATETEVWKYADVDFFVWVFAG